MTIANKLIVLRDKCRFSQQQVAEAIGVSKSTYCRYEKGRAFPGIDEINSILNLYKISYEDFVGLSLPLENTVSYPNELLVNLHRIILENGKPSLDYHENYEKYNRIKEAMEPILAIRDSALDFPNIDVSDIPKGTTVKVVKLDLRGEKLIKDGMMAQQYLYEAMLNNFNSYNKVQSGWR